MHLAGDGKQGAFLSPQRSLWGNIWGHDLSDDRRRNLHSFLAVFSHFTVCISDIGSNLRTWWKQIQIGVKLLPRKPDLAYLYVILILCKLLVVSNDCKQQFCWRSKSKHAFVFYIARQPSGCFMEILQSLMAWLKLWTELFTVLGSWLSFGLHFYIASLWCWWDRPVNGFSG